MAMSSAQGSGSASSRPANQLRDAVIAFSNEVFESVQGLLRAQHELTRAMLSAQLAAGATEERSGGGEDQDADLPADQDRSEAAGDDEQPDEEHDRAAGGVTDARSSDGSDAQNEVEGNDEPDESDWDEVDPDEIDSDEVDQDEGASESADEEIHGEDEGEAYAEDEPAEDEPAEDEPAEDELPEEDHTGADERVPARSGRRR
jgi:hypothetical protein